MGEPRRVTAQRSMSVSRAPAVAPPAMRVVSRRERDASPAGHAPLCGLLAARALQPRLEVGPVDDPYEREAERTADAVTGGAAPAAASRGPLSASIMRLVQRAVGKGDPPKPKDDDQKRSKLQRDAAVSGPEVVPARTEASVRAMSSGGDALPSSLRATFEPRFGYDFSGVRTHIGSDAAGAAGALGARAFTVGNHVYFGAGEFQPNTASGQRLIAHELTHTIQQTPAAARPVRVQRESIFTDPKGAALEKISKWADELPPYELLTVLLGRNPITDKPVERSARNFLHAALRLVPDGQAIFDDLEKNKSIEKTAAWFDAEVAKLNLTWDGIKALFRQAWDAIDALDFFNPPKAWEKIKAIFGPTLKRIADFALAVGGKILDAIRKIVLGKIGAWAKEQRGYLLLTFVLGKDPVTDEPVVRTPKTFVKAVLDLVPGGDKIFENLEKAKTIEKTVAWLDGEITKLDLTWDKIKELFRKAWDAFSVSDLLHPLTLIEKMAAIFLPPALRVIAFAIAVGKKVLEFIFEGAMLIAGPIGLQIVGIVRKIGDTFNKIVDDPVGFVGNLVKAVKLGFLQFSKNILDHLKTGLIEWLVGGLEGAGLVLPKVWDLRGILDLVLQILGISYAKIRGKLVKVLGEKTVTTLEKVFAFVKTLVTEGPVAAWKEIVEAIGGLWDLVIGGIKDWAITKIVTAAITKLVTLFNPAGAIIQAIIATYNTVAFFIERIKQILALVEAIVDSIANIAAGKLTQAANFVERAMARTIPVILGFLARLIGLGDVSTAVKNVITAIQAKVDKGIDFVIAFVVAKAKALFGVKDDKGDADPAAGGAGAPPEATFEDDEETHKISARMEGDTLVPTISSQTMPIDEFLAKAASDPAFDAKNKQAQLAAARAAVTALKTALKQLSGKKDKANKAAAQARENELAAALKTLLSGIDLKTFDEKYKLEGLVGTYGSIPKQSGDKLTPDHQPQAALVKYVADLEYVDPATHTRKLLFANKYVRTIVGGHATGAVAINLHEDRHAEGLTFKKPVPGGVLGDIKNAATETGSVEKKQKQVITVVRKRLNVEVDRMLTVAKNPKFYADVVKYAKGEKKAKPLIAKVRAQIEQGEGRIRSQNLDQWMA